MHPLWYAVTSGGWQGPKSSMLVRPCKGVLQCRGVQSALWELKALRRCARNLDLCRLTAVQARSSLWNDVFTPPPPVQRTRSPKSTPCLNKLFSVHCCSFDMGGGSRHPLCYPEDLDGQRPCQASQRVKGQETSQRSEEPGRTRARGHPQAGAWQRVQRADH